MGLQRVCKTSCTRNVLCSGMAQERGALPSLVQNGRSACGYKQADAGEDGRGQMILLQHYQKKLKMMNIYVIVKQRRKILFCGFKKSCKKDNICN